MVNLRNLRQNKQDQQGTSGLDSSEILALSGSGVSVFDTLDSLPSSPSEGDKALVDNINRLYISDGSGWYNIDLNTGFTPYWLTEPDATYEITDSVTPLLVTAKALDSDGTTPINQSFASDSAQYMVTVTNDSSVFTFTPKSADSIGIEVGAGNLTDSNGDFVYTFKWSDGINFVSKAVTITYNVVSGGGVWYGDRAVGAGNIYGGSGAEIFQFDITTLGNATDFGALLSTHQDGGMTALSNGTKALFMGGPRSSATRNAEIEIITIATAGNATDFGGNLLTENSVADGIHSGSYGFHSGGNANSGYVDTVQTVVIDTPGDATSFGTLQTAVSQNGNVTDNSRIVRGGNTGASDYQIQYWSNVSMTTAQDFGDWAGGTGIAGTAVGAGDRGIFWGRTYSDYTDIEYISIQTPSNATAFGNLLTNQLNNNGYGEYFSGSANNATRGTKFGGITSGGSNEIQYITMDTLGDGQDFGDLTYRSTYTCGTSGAAA
jgi:hypothetical protein